MQRVGFPSPPPEPPRPRRGVALAVLVGTVLVGGFLFVLAPAQRPPAPDPDPPIVVQPETTAIRAVERLVAAIDTGDVAGVEGTLAVGWVGIQLPGTTSDFLEPTTDPDVFLNAIAFNGAAVDLVPAGCEAERQTGPVDHLVRCVVEVTGPLPAALGHPQFIEIRAGTLAGDVLSLYHDGLTPQAVDYCVWASGEYPEMAATAFGPRCHPVASPEVATVHGQMATEYLAAGVPSQSADTREAVTIPRVLAGFERLYNEDALGGSGEEFSLFANTGPVTQFPGLLPDPLEMRSPFPTMPEFLIWSARSYDVALGACTIGQRYDFGGVEVSCPDAIWDGPLVSGLGLLPVGQPIEFVITDGKITHTFGETDAGLAEAADHFCTRTREDRNPFAALAFRSDCTPRYTVEAADAFIGMLDDYWRNLPA
jgi:hypothetical protein